MVSSSKGVEIMVSATLVLSPSCTYPLSRLFVFSAAQLVKVIEMLGTYSVSVKQLKGILSYLYATQVWVSYVYTFNS